MSSTGSAGAVGKICPYCRTTIEPGVPAVICPQCGIPHHADCWQENGRCTTFGCQGGGPARAPVATGPAAGDMRYLQERPCPVCGFLMRPLETVCPYCRNSIYAPQTPSYADPRAHLGRRPHRGSTILMYGILSFVCCALFGIAAWLMANEDLSAMDAGLMDDSGRGATEAGRVLGIVAVCLNAAVLFVTLLHGFSS